jgi:hypothetical protein
MIKNSYHFILRIKKLNGGAPVYRLQGNADILSELELRYDFTRRWSLMLFGGAGKAFDSWSGCSSTSWGYRLWYRL